MRTMKNEYEDFPSRTQSPFGISRAAYPGAVLLSSQSSSTNGGTMGSASGLLSPQISATSSGIPLNDLLGQQAIMLDGTHQGLQHPISSTSTAAGSAMMSPTPSSVFMDSFSNTSHLQQQQQSHSSIFRGQQSHSQMPFSQKPIQSIDTNMTLNFKQDINQLCSWMNTLTSSQQNTVLDNLLQSLNEDVLQFAKLKLESLSSSSYQSSPPLLRLSSPTQVSRDTPYQTTNMDCMLGENEHRNTSSSTNMHESNSSIFQNWPKPQSHMPVNHHIFDYFSDIQQRPKSVDPHVMKTLHGSLNSLSNSKKPYHQSYNLQSKGMTRGKSANDFENKNGNQHYYSNCNNNNNSSNQNQGQNNNQNNINLHNRQRSNNSHNSYLCDSSSSVVNSSSVPSASTTPNSATSSMNPKSLTDPKLLMNVPSWLKSLRLHKYSDALKDKVWVDLVSLDDSQLEALGVTALGARRKLLKAFSVVLDFQERGLIHPSAYETTSLLVNNE